MKEECSRIIGDEILRLVREGRRGYIPARLRCWNGCGKALQSNAVS